MEFVTSRAVARISRLARNASLLVACVIVAHQVVFVAQHGMGAELAQAMSEGGHDAYWLAFATPALLLAGAILLQRLLRLVALWRRADRRRGAHRQLPRLAAGRRQAGSTMRAGYLREAAGIWLWLLPLASASFALLENVEHLIGHGHLIGAGALTAPEYPLAIPALTALTLLAAALGGLVRWRERILTAQLAAGHRVVVVPATVGGVAVDPGWAITAALCRHHWATLPSDRHRAPPLLELV